MYYKKMNITNKLLKFWQGNITLWKSYWLVGELINALIIIIIFNIELRFFNNAHLLSHMPLLNFSDLNFINKCIILVWTIFITVGIWRSAEKYNGKIVWLAKIFPHLNQRKLWIILTLIILSYRLLIFKEIFN